MGNKVKDKFTIKPSMILHPWDQWNIYRNGYLIKWFYKYGHATHFIKMFKKGTNLDYNYQIGYWYKEK